jgi:phenylacetate-coenzyme A ligase PaaK-like adenylate-forming protein
VNNDLLCLSPFELDSKSKTALYNKELMSLTKFHYENCIFYKKILDGLEFDTSKEMEYSQIPFIPVRLFKEFNLLSINEHDLFKTLTSSGTTGQKVSKIFLNKETASLQQKILMKIVTNFLGPSRLPMLIIDSPSVIKDKKMFSARGAGILGFSIFGTSPTYALDEEMNINVVAIENFLEKNQGEKVLLFGFTFMIWEYFYKKIQLMPKKFDLSNGILIHGGGLKKLLNEAVSKEEFKQRLKNVCSIESVHDYYGMVEQTGSIYMECDYGHLHTSIYSDVIFRRSKDFSACEIGEKGIVQVISLLAESYPGHSLLTEDEGILLGIDDCPCERKGKYFKILGRIKTAEVRGCSDTFEGR